MKLSECTAGVKKQADVTVCLARTTDIMITINQ